MSVADTKFELCHDVERVLKIGRDFQKQDSWRGAHHDTAKLLCDTIEYLCDRLNMPAGNMAATRDALRVADETANELLSWCSNHYQELNCMGSRLKRALERAAKAPPRNCDRKFIDRVAMYSEFKDWCNKKGHTIEPKLAYDAFDWLLATREGGAK